MNRSSRVVTAAAAAVVVALATPAAAGPLDPPSAEPTEWRPGPEDGPAAVEPWPDGQWDLRLAGGYEGRTASGAGELDAVGATVLVVDGGDLVAAAPFQLGLYGPAEGWVPGLEGSADVAWVYAGDVAAEAGRVVLRAASVAWSLEDMVIDGQAVPFPAQSFTAANVFPMLVTSATCGLVEGTWDGDAVAGMMEASGGDAVITEREPRRFRAVSDEVDEEWLERAEAVADRIATLDPLAPLFLVDVLDVVLDAEQVAREAAGDPCASTFSLGIDAQLEAALLALLEGPPLRPDELWQVAQLLARAGVQPGSAAHAAAVAQLQTQIDLLAQGDVAGAVQLLTIAQALGDAGAAARLQLRIGDPGGQLPGSWLPGR